MPETAFAVHFRNQGGSAPLEYRARWRMAIARAALGHPEESLAAIAARIGYFEHGVPHCVQTFDRIKPRPFPQ
jgi:AraC-like DNA-binding protein